MGKDLITVAEELSKSAQKYNKELLLLPGIYLAQTLPFFTVRDKIQYKETTGSINGKIQLRPYAKKTTESNIQIDARSIEVYLGAVIEKFDPNTLQKTVFGSLIASGKALENVDFSKVLLAYMVNQISENIASSLFSATIKADGTTTEDLFNGFDTITAAEISAGSISVENKNLFIHDEISKENAVDILKEFYRASNPVLKRTKTNLYVPYEVLEIYQDCYKAESGGLVYNKTFDQNILEGSNDLCTIVPMVCKEGSKFMQLAPRENMIIGTNGIGDAEKIEVRRGDDPFALQFSAAMMIGCQFASIDPRMLNVAKVKTI